ncbi:acyltransferase [Aggregicoccus sp. 17bor-14]|uniref:acyltransferase family protein n=1 Tax=Myxococcaceae TaxID=31 RepID=UPI00129C8D5D|nr:MULTISPECIES: acyltransferase [Myxococcaceae]MBF5042584.1 acyltransferase [Simulacricoccus sp. 17bor-14]MRI88353.1 acyltransferase [Aggregicoccus sp. 17bor-14]
MTAPRTESSPAPQHLHGLDTLRALAILLVFAFHYQVFVSREPTFGWASTVGWTGVDLFFVLSGYLIGRQLMKGATAPQGLSIPRFYARRFLRTLPNYYGVLALYLAFPAVLGGREPPALWRFLTFTQNLGLEPGTAFSHAWSLCVEEQFYVLLPLAVVAAVQLRPPRWAAWALMGGLVAAGIAVRRLLWVRYGREAGGGIEGYHPNIYYSSLCRFDEFLPGVAVAFLQTFHPQLWQRLTRYRRALLAAGLLAVTGALALVLTRYQFEGYGYGYFMTGFGYSLVACAFALLVVAALCPGSLLHRVRVPGAERLAAWSYAIYLTHKPIAFALHRRLGTEALVGKAGEVALIAAACLVGGWLLYRFVEQPFMRLRERYVPSHLAPPTPAEVASIASAP